MLSNILVLMLEEIGVFFSNEFNNWSLQFRVFFLFDSTYIASTHKNPKKPATQSENGIAATATNGSFSKPLSPVHSTERTVKKLRLSKALTIPEGTTVYNACRRMVARRIDVVLLNDAKALQSGIITDKEDGVIRSCVKLLIAVDGHSFFVPSIDNLAGMGFYKPFFLVSSAKRRVSGAKEGLLCRYMRVIGFPYKFEAGITFVESLVSPNNWGENRKNRRRSKPTQ
ncbi:hypothetical protein AgCh_022520 [Apium graveolens]